MSPSTQSELERHSRELALLYEIIRSTNYHLSLQDILTRAVQTLVAGMEVQAGAIYLRAGDEMLLSAVEGLPRPLQRQMERFDHEQARRLLELQLVDAHQLAGTFPFCAGAVEAGLPAWLVVNLHTREVQAGLLMLAAGEPARFDARDVDLVSRIADYLAIAIENAVLFEEMRRSLRRQQALNWASQTINASLEPERVFSSIVHVARELAGADAAAVFENDDSPYHLTLLAESGLSPAFRQSFIALLAAGRLPDAVLEALAASEAAPLPRLDKEPAGPLVHLSLAEGYQAFLTVPLLQEGRKQGAVALWWREPQRFTMDLVTALTTLANQSISAIQNARLSSFNERIIRSMDEGILIEDAEGYITFANPRMAEMLGYRSPEELIGQRILSWIDTRDRFVARLQHDAVLAGERRRYEATFQTKDGGTLPVLASSIPLLQRPGQPPEILTVVTDISELKRLQQQLIQSEKLAALGGLVAGVAHELNNPLTSIIGYAQLIKAGGVSATAAEDLKRVIQQAQRAADIVRNLLAFARQERPQRKLVDVNDIIERTIALRSYELRVQNIQVELDLDKGVPATLADPQQLQQVILNLILNAEQAMSKSGVGSRLTIRTRRTDAGVIVEVRDNGPGIPPAIMGRIFDPFFTTKEPGEGTGLGLSICYGIVQEHGGRIWAESEGIPGKGAAFFVHLPPAPPQSRIAAEEAQEQKSAPPTAGRRGSRILIVDDEQDIVEIAARVLAQQGHLVDVARSGQEAIRCVERRGYDLIVCDIKMPGMNGISFWEELTRRDPGWRKRIVFMTGDMANEQTVGFLQEAGAPVLQKPFELQRLNSWIQEMLQEQGKAGARSHPKS